MADYEVVDLPKDYEVVDLPKKKTPYFAGVASHKAAAATLESSHMKQQLTPMRAPEIDPGTGRQKTTGRTMTDEESMKFGTKAAVIGGATAGSLMAGPVVAPMLAFARAGPLATFAVTSAARMLGAVLGGAGGEAYGQLFEHAHGVGPARTGESASRIGESAKDMAEMEAFGLGIEGVSKVATGGVKAVGSKVYEALKTTDVYKKMVAAKAAAVVERNLVVAKKAAETAEEIANAFVSNPSPGSLDVRGPSLVKAAEAVTEKNTKIMYEGFKKAIEHKTVDYRDVAQMIVDIEKKTPRAKGGLSVMTKPDPEWARFVEAMSDGNKSETVEIAKEVMATIKGAKGEKIMLSPAMTQVVPPKNAAEAAAAVVDARGTISQRLAALKRTGEAPREYVEGLEKALTAIDGKLEKVAGEVGPGVPDLFAAAKKYFGASREIQKQAMYRVLKNGGDIAGALMDASAPEGVAVLKSLAQETGDRSIVPVAQRAVIEKLLSPGSKGLDLARFTTNLEKLGKTGEHLFSDPRASRVIAGIKEQAQALNRLEAVPRLSGEGAEAITGRLISRALPVAIGYSVGRKATGNWEGGTIGAGVGAMSGKQATEFMLKLAENPEANRMFLAALQTVNKTGEFTGEAVSQAAKALKMVGELRPLGEAVKNKAEGK